MKHRSPHTLLLTLGALFMLSAALPNLALAQGAAVEVSPNRCQEDYAPPEARRDPVSLAMLGIACFERGEFGRALAFYRAAYERSQAPLLEAAIGRSLHELGIWSAAMAYYELYLDHEQDDQDGRARIQERLVRIQKQLNEQAALVTIDAHPGTATAYIQTTAGHREYLGPTPLTVRLKPSRYTILIERDGFYTSSQEVNLSPKQEVKIRSELIPQDAAFTLTTRQFRRVGGITLLASAPILTLGGVMTVLGTEDTRRQGAALLIVGTSGLIIGTSFTLLGLRRERRIANDQAALLLLPTGLAISF